MVYNLRNVKFANNLTLCTFLNNSTFLWYQSTNFITYLSKIIYGNISVKIASVENYLDDCDIVEIYYKFYLLLKF